VFRCLSGAMKRWFELGPSSLNWNNYFPPETCSGVGWSVQVQAIVGIRTNEVTDWKIRKIKISRHARF
jgi:hypothetical protein